MEEMLGSYAPGKTNEKKFPLEEAPSGMLARGKYDARSKFTDDDGHSYLDFSWSFEVWSLVHSTNSATD
jgi:Rho GDP-dissociation inhibitor